MRQFRQRIPREVLYAAMLALSEIQYLQRMALLAYSDPDHNPNHREDNEDGRARSGDGDHGAQSQHPRLVGVLPAKLIPNQTALDSR